MSSFHIFFIILNAIETGKHSNNAFQLRHLYLFIVATPSKLRYEWVFVITCAERVWIKTWKNYLNVVQKMQKNASHVVLPCGMTIYSVVGWWNVLLQQRWVEVKNKKHVCVCVLQIAEHKTSSNRNINAFSYLWKG